jgi:hypothetical protein
MKRNTTWFMLAFVLAISNSSCVHYYYAPNTNNVPLFKEKNEGRIQASFASTATQNDIEDANGFELQSAYAIGNHTALQFNLFNASETEDEGSGSGTYVEAACGYFKPLGVHHHWVFETYGGFGYGGVKNEFGGGVIAKTSILKFFAQPSFGFTSKYFDMAFSSKLSLASLGYISSDISKDTNPLDYDYVESLRRGKSYFLWEPGLMLRGGFKNVKLSLQLTEAVFDENKLPFSDATAAIGLIINLNPKPKTALK